MFFRAFVFEWLSNRVHEFFVEANIIFFMPTDNAVFALARQQFIRPRHPARTLMLLFLALIFMGGVCLRLPLSAQGEPLDWSAAYFTATSAVCVTGLSVFDVKETLSPMGQVILLFLVQAGGLGYMLASTLLLLVFGREPRLHERLLLRSTLGQVTLRDTRNLVLRAVVFTFCVEAIGAVILTVRFMALPGFTFFQALWYGIFHSVSAFCNAGFDLFGIGPGGQHSLGAFRSDVLVNVTIAVLIALGGLGFAVYQEFLVRWQTPKLERLPLSLHTRVVLVMSAALWGIFTVAILVTEWTNPHTLGPLSLGEKLMTGCFHAVSLRSGGYSTIDFGALRSITLMICGMGMFVGAAPGGTSGGIKLTTFAAMAATVIATLRGKTDVELFHRRLPVDTVRRSLVLVFVSFCVIVIGMIVVTFTEPNALIEAGHKDNLFMRLQFEVLSAFGTTGLSTGVTPHITDAGRLVLMVLMLAGRLGPITAATALAAPLPQLRRRLPEEEIALG